MESGILVPCKGGVMATREPEHGLYRKLPNFAGSTDTQKWLNSKADHRSDATRFRCLAAMPSERSIDGRDTDRLPKPR
ncbi:hypothetical protein T265_04370 [Opisthorchis viverrini]|uniref:Uncharacterized protein n=1 Tax=Opisthorchis viverrini TaxID=6198 RepID=A0A075A018_OPIVI|nr:hypothetical protein T265_04370 [Opisthorchis viverrini]KER28910.1 hypothetical protein T265_04370 [Opisthorchis viverrini]